MPWAPSAIGAKTNSLTAVALAVTVFRAAPVQVGRRMLALPERRVQELRPAGGGHAAGRRGPAAPCCIRWSAVPACCWRAALMAWLLAPDVAVQVLPSTWHCASRDNGSCWKHLRSAVARAGVALHCQDAEPDGPQTTFPTSCSSSDAPHGVLLDLAGAARSLAARLLATEISCYSAPL